MVREARDKPSLATGLIVALFVIFMIFACSSLGVLTYVPENEVSAGFKQIFGTFRMSANAIILSIAGSILLALGGALILTAWYGLTTTSNRWFQVQKTRAEAIEAHNRARLAGMSALVAPADNQIVISEITDEGLLHRMAHVSPGSMNGKPTIYTETERETWEHFHDRHGKQQRELPPPHLMLNAPIEQEQKLDLLATLDSAQRCLIVGASNSGKTTLLQHIITRRLMSSKVVVIDPHAAPGKWPNCDVIGVGRNYEAIGQALDALVRLMTKRYKEIGEGAVIEGTHPKVTVVIDEWRAIVYNVKGSARAIAALLTESRKAAFSVFVGTHSERVKALGIDGEGDLKDGFVIVRLSIVNGNRRATVDFGDGQIEATLPGPYLYAIPPQIISGQAESVLDEAEPEPGDTEAEILAMWDEGERRVSAIAEMALGYKGGPQNAKVKEVLARFGRV